MKKYWTIFLIMLMLSNQNVFCQISGSFDDAELERIIKDLHTRVEEKLHTRFYDESGNQQKENWPAFNNTMKQCEDFNTGLNVENFNVDTIIFDDINNLVCGNYWNIDRKNIDPYLFFGFSTYNEISRFENEVAEFYAITEDQKDIPVYKGMLTLKLSQKRNEVSFVGLFEIYKWQYIDTELKYEMVSSDSFIGINSLQITNNHPDDDKITENSYNLSKLFFSKINEFLSKKKDRQYADYFLKNILDSFSFSFNNFLILNKNKWFYFNYNMEKWLYNFYNNLLDQYGVEKPIDFIEYEEPYEEVKKAPDHYQFKYNYYLRDGIVKNGKYQLNDEYRNLLEYTNLPSWLKDEFSKSTINSRNIISPQLFSVSIDANKIIMVTMIDDSSLKDYHSILSRRLEDENSEIYYDILEFFSRYSTALNIQNKYILGDAWYNRAFRATYYDRYRQEAVGNSRIIEGLKYIWKEKNIWVSYIPIKNNINFSYDVNFLNYNNTDDALFVKIQTYNLKEHINFVVKISMNQKWINFLKYQNLISYASFDIVDFYLNIFNTKKIIEFLENKNEKNINNENIFGLMLYLKYLFKNDGKYNLLKNKYRLKNGIKQFLDLTEPDLKDISYFINNKLCFSMIKNGNKDLLDFFKSDDYVALHLNYGVYHSAFIQILASHTNVKGLEIPGIFTIKN